jgi:hypothetical protein
MMKPKSAHSGTSTSPALADFTVYARAALSDLRFGVFDLADKRPLIKGT